MNQPQDSIDTLAAPGHETGVAALFREHNRALVAFLQCRLGSLADAQELAQESFLRMLALERLGQQQADSPRAFLFRIAANLAVDRLRMRKLRDVPPIEEVPEPMPELHLAPVPERHAMASEQWRELQVALRELPAKTSQAFVLHVLEGRDFDAIAQTMNLSARMVRYHVTRALAHCRARVVEEREMP
ncbi:sigma-70 family RNA polymerase sigma factor [Rhodanobacter sp. DHB23]|uniref:RNA polymerase sigma factor n=1 Tax=Rhodanobacter sp. DHB23 TaxID=2775923 RepID=UPI001784AE6F|nr:sigma-70 family RNA polymerase sigma factor [Rhodanobacter sp. DHB23]MBD8873946.1 sigma-70 family RNA polymerase sigma factor [Rhodanobacter sp. DHB23]